MGFSDLGLVNIGVTRMSTLKTVILIFRKQILDEFYKKSRV